MSQLQEENTLVKKYLDEMKTQIEAAASTTIQKGKVKDIIEDPLAPTIPTKPESKWHSVQMKGMHGYHRKMDEYKENMFKSLKPKFSPVKKMDVCFVIWIYRVIWHLIQEEELPSKETLHQLKQERMRLSIITHQVSLILVQLSMEVGKKRIHQSMMWT
jgi:hypothetical protein